MEFRLDRFYRLNRRVLIWAAFFALIYVLRDFFALVFLTFLTVSFTLPAINYFQRNTRMPRTVIIVALYLAILVGLVGLTYYIVPRITVEASAAAHELANIETNLTNLKPQLQQNYPSLVPLVTPFLNEEQISSYVKSASANVQVLLAESAKMGLAIVSNVLLSLLFSFLIVLDLARLTEQVRGLERSRLHDFYAESAGPLVNFGAVIARALRAQAMIAVTNTILTLVGFLVLGVPKVALLSIVVFFFSFIPVLGVFISTTPAVIVAINHGGFQLAVAVIIMIILIHLVEAYILNPLIYGHHLKLNPVLVMLILYVGHHFFGLWGALLGVPVTYYFLFYVLGVPLQGLHKARDAGGTKGDPPGDAVSMVQPVITPPKSAEGPRA